MAYFIVLERKIRGLDTGMDGKGLSLNIGALDEAARQLGVRPLSEFYSGDPDEMADFLESEGVETGEDDLPPLENFEAQEGLETVRALAADEVSQAEGVAEDLRECDRILTSAAAHGVTWHFEIDI